MHTSLTMYRPQIDPDYRARDFKTFAVVTLECGDGFKADLHFSSTQAMAAFATQLGNLARTAKEVV